MMNFLESNYGIAINIAESEELPCYFWEVGTTKFKRVPRRAGAGLAQDIILKINNWGLAPVEMPEETPPAPEGAIIAVKRLITRG